MNKLFSLIIFHSLVLGVTTVGVVVSCIQDGGQRAVFVADSSGLLAFASVPPLLLN